MRLYISLCLGALLAARGTFALSCWDGEYDAKQCCGEAPLRDDCWVPALGLTREACCSEIPESGVERRRRMTDFLGAVLVAVERLSVGGLRGCSSAHEPLLEVLERLGVPASPRIREALRALAPRVDGVCAADAIRMDRLAASLAASGLAICPDEAQAMCRELARLFRRHAQRFWAHAQARSAARLVAAVRRARRPPGPPMDIALVASVGRPAFGRKALGTVRSALLHAEARPLRFHLVVDEEGAADMQRALSTLEPNLAARGEFLLYRSESLQRVWRRIRAMVPGDCLAYEPRYGSPGWLRLFAHEIIDLPSVTAVLWVDAGDFIFFADPAELLSHFDRFGEEHIVGAPVSHALPFQLFDLQKMRSRGWNELVAAAFRSGYAQRGAQFCELGEGETVSALVSGEASLHVWYWLPSAWAYEPWELWLYGHGVLDDAEALPFVWDLRPFSGMADFMSLDVPCLGVEESLANFALQGRVSNSGWAGVLDLVVAQARSRWSNQTLTDDKGQVVACGERVKAAHFVLPFHYVPWVHRVLNFWTGSGSWDADWNSGRDLRV